MWTDKRKDARQSPQVVVVNCQLGGRGDELYGGHNLGFQSLELGGQLPRRLGDAEPGSRSRNDDAIACHRIVTLAALNHVLEPLST